MVGAVTLTILQREIAARRASGQSYDAISAALGISPRRVARIAYLTERDRHEQARMRVAMTRTRQSHD